MIDDIDEATKTAELYTASAARHRKPEVRINPTGKCLNCSARVKKNRRWCDKVCMEEWEDGQ